MKRISLADDASKNLDGSRRSLTSRQFVLRLGLAFSLLIALLIAIGYMGLRRMDSINNELQEAVSKQWTKLRLSREAVTYSNRNSRIMMDIMLIKDREQVAPMLAARKENTEKISALLANLKNLCQSEEERRLLGVVNDRRGAYVESYLQSLRLLVDEKKPEAAAAIMVRQTTPELLKYQDAWDDFMRFQENQLDQVARQSGARSSAARRLTLLVIMLSVVVAGAISLFVIGRILRELTAHLRDEKKALQAAHQGAEVFINAVPSILIGLDHGARIVRWNSKAASVFGLSRDKVIGKQLAGCGITWLQPGLQEETRSWCSGSEPRRCDLPFEMDGKARLLGLTITPVQMDDKAFTTLLIGSDITDQRALEGQLRQALKLESVGQLASGIAHEINTPTQYIGDNVRFLKDAFQDMESLRANYERLLLAAKGNTLSPEIIQEVAAAVARVDTGYLVGEIPKAIDQALEGVSRVSTLVSAMKEFSHPDTKEKTMLDLNHAINSTITVARNEWKYVSDVETDFDPSLPLISCQPGEFNQVILNLIVNAAQAIGDVVKKGGPEKGKIKVQTRNCQDCVEIQVQDTGSGIPEKVRARIFDPFFTTKEIGKGTGQGLAIARSVIVDKHGGSIHFESEEGKGTTFIIRLPFDGKSLTPKAVAA
jgi:PAS domain S-box-containing protein